MMQYVVVVVLGVSLGGLLVLLKRRGYGFGECDSDEGPDDFAFQEVPPQLLEVESEELPRGSGTGRHKVETFARSGSAVRAGGRLFRLLAVRGLDQSAVGWVGRVLNLHPKVSVVEEMQWPFPEDTAPGLVQFLPDFPFASSEGTKDLYARVVVEHVLAQSPTEKKDPGGKKALATPISWIGECGIGRGIESHLAGARVIFVVRDVRDVVVTSAFQYMETCKDRALCKVIGKPALDGLLQKKAEAHKKDPRHFRTKPRELFGAAEDQEWVNHMAESWQADCDRAARLRRSRGASLVLVLYEELLASFGLRAGDLFAALGLRPQDASAPSNRSFTTPGMQRPIGRWRRYATHPFIAGISAAAGRGLLSLGYELNQTWAALDYSAAAAWEESPLEDPAARARPLEGRTPLTALAHGGPAVPRASGSPAAGRAGAAQRGGGRDGRAPAKGAGAGEKRGPEDEKSVVIDRHEVKEGHDGMASVESVETEEEGCTCDPSAPTPNITLAMGLYDAFGTSAPSSPSSSSLSSGSTADLTLLGEDVELNTGNLVWRYGTFNLLAESEIPALATDASMAFTRERRQRIGHLFIGAGPILTSASEFTLHREKIENIHKVIQASDRRTLVVGLGIQKVWFTQDGHRDLDPKRTISVGAADVHLHPAVLSFLADLEVRATGDIGVRGKFTEELMQRYGFRRFKDMGCPSLFLNPRKDLGQVLQEKYSTLKKQMGTTSFKIAVQLPMWWAPQIVRMLILLVQRFPGSIVIMQNRYEEQVLERARLDLNLSVPTGVTRIFKNLEEWRNTVQELNLVIGMRMLGSMVSIWAETPVVTIATDWRVKEMCESMKMTYLELYDTDLKAGQPLRAVIQAAKAFSGENFDKRRQELGLHYDSMFQSAGLKLREQVAVAR